MPSHTKKERAKNRIVRNSPFNIIGRVNKKIDKTTDKKRPTRTKPKPGKRKP